jgi:sterol desaturase/sphingolipid hydroxylase (fatty acid hydroxylase superfamily)
MDAGLRSADPLDVVAWVATFFIGLTALSLAIGFALERILSRRRIWSVALDPGQLRHEIVGNVVFVAIAIASFSAALLGDAIRFGEPSLGRGLATFGALALGFQLYYYALHRALHHRSLVRFHRWHHVSRVTTPLSGQSMSAVEALGWMLGYVGLPMAISYAVPISASGWIAYIAYNVFANIVGHSNVELTPKTPILRWTSLAANTIVFHALHHARWNGHYSFAAALMDRCFRSEWPDWYELHARVDRGEPLPSLKIRGAALRRSGEFVEQS